MLCRQYIKNKASAAGSPSKDRARREPRPFLCAEGRQPLHTPLMKVLTSPISLAFRGVSRDEDRSNRHEGQRGETSPRRHPQTQESDTCTKIQKICQHRRPHPLKQELRHGRGLVSTPTCPPTTAANTCGPAWLSADASRKSEMSCLRGRQDQSPYARA